MRIFAGWAAVLVVAVGCGGGNPPPAPTTPATNPIATAPPPAKVDLSPVPEPTGLVVVGRIAKPDSILKAVGTWTGLPLPGGNELVRSMTDEAVAASIDFSQPVDGAVILAGSRMAPKPLWAFALPVKSVDDAKAKLGAKHRLTATTNGAFKIEGLGASGVIGGEKGRDDEDDELDCVLAPAVSPPNSGRIVCGADEELTPYLTRTLPKQSFPTDLHVEMRFDPVRGPVSDLRAQLPILARSLMGSQTQAVRDLVDAAINELGDIVADTNRLVLDGTFDDKGIKLDFRGEYGSAKSLMAQLATTGVDKAGPPPPAFFHLPQETDVAFFSKGSDPKLFTHVREIVSNLLVEVFTEGGMPDAERKSIKDLVANRMMPLFTGPVVYGKGYDQAAVEKAAAAKRAARGKDVANDDADKLLGEQIIGWHLLQVGEPIANVGPMLKDWSAVWARPGFQTWAKKASSAKMLSKLKIAPPPAGATLPKETVHLEITIPRDDIEDPNAPRPPPPRPGAKTPPQKPKMIPRKPIVAHILAVPDAGATWIAIGFGDPTALVKKVAASLSSAPDQGTLGKMPTADPLRETAKMNGAMMLSMRGLLVVTAGDGQSSPFSKLPMLPNKGATPAYATFVAQGPQGDAKAGVATGTLRIPRGLIEDAVRLAFMPH
jgi:hypothetical protein